MVSSELELVRPSEGVREVRHLPIDCGSGLALLFTMQHEGVNILWRYVLQQFLAKVSFQYFRRCYVTFVSAWRLMQSGVLFQVAVTEHAKGNVGLFVHVEELPFTDSRPAFT